MLVYRIFIILVNEFDIILCILGDKYVRVNLNIIYRDLWCLIIFKYFNVVFYYF